MDEKLIMKTENKELNVDDLLKQLDSKISKLFVKHENEFISPKSVKGFLLEIADKRNNLEMGK